jgi:pimeloyl-ACP methyl ester carboxylesterase
MRREDESMPTFEREGVSLYYQESGSGYPLLLFAPGGMRSGIEFWRRSPFDPIAELASDFRVIAMDQRNAGRSRAPLSASDGWHAYTADHLALLDHIGVQRCHLMGGCIGSSYCLSLIEAAPNRVSAAVLQNPIGLSASNRGAFVGMFDEWANSLERKGVDASETLLASFRHNMYGGDFVFSVSRDFVKSCRTPMLVLAGNDQFHPAETAREIAKLAPNCELTLEWKAPEIVKQTVDRVRAFLKSHTSP